MEKYLCNFNKSDMVGTLVCVKQVKQEISEDWDESMPLPGDIIEGFCEDETGELFVPAKGKSELSSQLGRILQQAETIWLKVRRGDNNLKIQARVVPEKYSVLKKSFTIKAATDDRHVAVLADLTFEQCAELQEMSRRVVNMDCKGFGKRGVKYDWNKKVGTYLPDKHCSVVGSILFMPLQGELCIEAITSMCMAWYSAAVSSGVPLVFVNIQTEQAVNLEQSVCTGKEQMRSAHPNQRATLQTVQSIRLWFLPGIAEVFLVLRPQPGEDRFGMDIKRTEEGFFCVYSITKDSAADRAGMGNMQEEANENGHLLVISRLEGKSLMPSRVCCMGLIHCCDHNEVNNTLTSAIEQMDSIQVHFMVWPKGNLSHPSNNIGVADALRPPGGL